MVLVESSLRLKQEHDDAAKRVDKFIEEADAVRDSSPDSTADAGAGSRGGGSGRGRAGSGGSGDGSRSGSDSKGNISDGGGSGSGTNGETRGRGGAGGGRRKKKGYAHEEDSDSDDGEHQARLLRSRGPVTLNKAFAVPLLRSCVVAFREGRGDGSGLVVGSGGGGGAGSRGMAAASGARGKGKGGAAARGARARGAGGGGEAGAGAEVSDEKLLAVFEYWSKKREAYGGPMLRCFHAFMMKLWRRMEDPVREVRVSVVVSVLWLFCALSAVSAAVGAVLRVYVVVLYTYIFWFLRLMMVTMTVLLFPVL